MVEEEVERVMGSVEVVGWEVHQCSRGLASLGYFFFP